LFSELNLTFYKSDGLQYCPGFCIGECPSNSPFLKNNAAEALKGPRSIVYKEWRDTRTFTNLISTHFKNESSERTKMAFWNKHLN
jgi:hypothetical protein